MKFLRTFLVGVFAAMFATTALAAPLPYINTPFDTPQAMVNTAITSINNNGGPAFAYPSTCTGTTTATCTGLKFTVSVTGLTTTAGVTSASMTVTNASIVASSIVMCQAEGYGGAGNPQSVNVVPTASTLVFQVQNTHASAALNATVPIACFVYN